MTSTDRVPFTLEQILAAVDATLAAHGDYVSNPTVTPLTHPDHHTVGKDFMGYSGAHKQTARWHCVSYDQYGYNMVNRGDIENTINVSERAIGRTFHEVRVHHDEEGQPRHEHSQWGPVLIDLCGQPRETGRIVQTEEA